MTIRWLAIAAVTAGVSLLTGAVGLPTPVLFAALAVGIAYALLSGAHALRIPARGIVVAQALIGVALGTEMHAATLGAVAADWFGVSVVTVGTLAASLVAGIVFAALTGIGRRTGMLGLVAGGASGVIAMSEELGADDRLVAFMQYLRVLVVVLLAPLVANVFLHDSGRASIAPQLAVSSLTLDIPFTVGCAVAGVLLGRFLRVTTGSLLGPLVVAGAISVSGLGRGAEVPELLQNVAFAIIGLQVGLRFTIATIIEARRLLLPVLLALFGLIGVCAAFAVLLVSIADVTFADAYLATTPGGLYAVLAAAIGIGADTTFVVSVQVLRVFVIVLAAPALIRVLAPRPSRQLG